MTWPAGRLGSRVAAHTLAASLVAGTVSAVGLVALTHHQAHGQLTERLRTLAAALSDRAGSALDAGDAEAARRSLAPLETDPIVDAAFVTWPDGRPFAAWTRRRPVANGSNAGAVLVRSALVHGTEVVGQLEIVGTLSPVNQQVQQSLWHALGVAGVMLVTGMLIAVRLKRRVVDPVRRLACVASGLPTADRAGVRAIRETPDEIGDLADHLNALSRLLEERDAALRQARAELETGVRERTQALEQEVQARRKSEQALVLAKASAEEANTAKSLLLASLSHELRAPLNAILGYGEMLQTEAQRQESEQVFKDSGRILLAGRHLLSLINTVLDLSKIEAGRLPISSRDFEIEPFVRGVQAIAEPLAARHDNELRVRVSGNLGTMRSDRTRVQQVLLNLLSNACKFTLNGRVTLDVSRRLDLADEVIFRVEDTGVGISDDQQARLFREFSQATAGPWSSREGTGLGLVISQRISQVLGGEISVDSTPGVGSIFTLRLPATLETPPPTPAPDAPCAPPAATGPDHRPAVLIVDSNAADRELIARTVDRVGMRPVAIAPTHDLRQRVAASRPSLIILDVRMPRADGYAVLRRLTSDPVTAGIPVIVASLTTEANRSLSAGARAHLTKPIDTSRLIAVLGQLAAGVPT